MSWELELNKTVLEELYFWIDSLPLSKPKKRIERDFSDGILAAEVIRYYLPDLVDMHNYTPANALSHKKVNWGILNQKILLRLGLDLPETIITNLSNGKRGFVEIFLFNLRLKIDEELELRRKVQEKNLPSEHQSLVSSNTIVSKSKGTTFLLHQLNQISRSMGIPNKKWVSQRDYAELKQQSLQHQEEIEILQARMRQLQHMAQLKDIHISELESVAEENRRAKPTAIVGGNYKKK